MMQERIQGKSKILTEMKNNSKKCSKKEKSPLTWKNEYSYNKCDILSRLEEYENAV